MGGTRGGQFRALFLKNLGQQRQQKGTTVVQLVIPLVLVLLVGLVQMLIDNLAANNSDPSVEYYGPVDLSATLPYHPDGRLDRTSLFFATPFFLVTAPPALRQAMGELSFLGNRSGLLGNIVQDFQEPFLTIPGTFWPFCLPKDSEEELYNLLIEMYRKWKVLLNDSGLGPAPEPEEYPKILNYTQIWLSNRDYEELLPFGAMYFNEISSEKINYTALAATRYGGWPFKSTDNRSLSDLQVLFVDIDRRGNIINLVNNAYLNYLNPNPEQPLKITTYYQAFPQSMIFTFDLSSIAGVFLYGFVTSLLLPVFISNLVTDKQEKVLLMMQMSGLRMSIYWLVAYLYDMFLYVIVLVVVYLTSFLFRMRMFTQTNPVVLILFFVLWGNVLTSLCFLLSTFFSKARTASVAGYFLVIISVVVSNLLNSSVFLAASPPIYYMIYPPFAYYRGIFLMEEACIDLMCFQLDDLAKNSELRDVFLFLFFESLVLFPLTYYLQNILPNEFGVRKSPLFFLDPLFNLFRKRPSKNGYVQVATSPNEEAELKLEMDQQEERKGSRGESFSKNVVLDNYEDEDVIEERRRILRGEVPGTAQVVISHLTKEYEGRYGQPKKKAVRGVSFFIDQNECFGLLGGNGAGKTTLISILTGVFSPSSGSASIAGFDITSEMDDVQSQIGVCPQFDIFYPELTTREHLLFYARLKGVQNEQEAVKMTLEEMGLSSVAERQSRNLSGGMRRRLSMGIAIIGNPKIIILDEPTTGLDPLTRRQIWETLTELKKNRSMILTTHSMEEADVLCTRIGIMSRGLMKCIGTQAHLKNKFGTGYSLTVFTHPQQISEATAFVQQRFPAAQLEESFSGTLTFRIAKDQLVVSELFHVMQNERPEFISDYGLQMTTLEDVFLQIARLDEAENETSPLN